MKKLLLSFVVLGITSVLAIGATTAYFSDTEVSSANTFTAGTLDLELDGGVTTAKFTVNNMRPDSQNIGVYHLKNTGTLNGYVDIENILVTSYENGCTEAEQSFGDSTCNNPGMETGELQNLVSLSKLFWDVNCNGWYGDDDITIYDGKVGNLPTSFDLSAPLNAGQEKCIAAQFNWWASANDNLGQGDSFVLDLGFELGQKIEQ